MHIIAHRGASGVCGQDNTLASFERAIALGCDFIELDVRRTKDHTLVCFHDASINEQALKDLTYSQLQELSSVPVPTLKDAVQLCASRIGILVEFKESDYEQDVLDVLKDHAGDCSLLLMSFKVATVRRCVQWGSWPVGLLVGTSGETKNLDETLATCGAQTLVAHHSFLDAPLPEAVKSGRIPLYLWTIDDPEMMRRAKDAGIDGLITNRPDFALAQSPKGFRLATDEWVEAQATASQNDASALIDSLCRLDVDGRTVPTAHIRIGSGVLAEVPAWTQMLWGPNAKIGLVMDVRTREAAGNFLEQLLPDATCHVLQPREGWSKVTPQAEFCQEIETATKSCDALLAVGSGTVNDLVKFTAHHAGKPYAAIATAASMNGYTSSIAALLKDGLKQTLPCTPPCLVLADVSVLAKAPLRMTQAGYADLLSKNPATADWKLGTCLADEVFSSLPWSITDRAIEGCVQQAEGLAKSDEEAVETLIQALILSGFAMSLAGSSSPASGGEHLVSHLLDMNDYAANAVPALHGLQVSLGTQLTLRLYECLRKTDPSRFKANTVTEQTLAEQHGTLWPVIRTQALSFLRIGDEAQARVEVIRAEWNGLWESLDSVLLPASELRTRLKRAGVPTEPEAFGIERTKLRFAFLHGADVRARYTVLHLARDIGMLEKLVDEVFEVFDE